MVDADSLASFILLRDLSATQRAEIAARLVPRAIERGEILIAQSDPSESLFFVLSGRFVVRTAECDATLVEIGVGEPIGEIGFFARIPRSATVLAARDSTVLQLDRVEFEQIAKSLPGIYEIILEAMARRLAAATAQLPAIRRLAQSRTLAIIGAGGADISAAFVERLRSVLERNAHVLFLHSESEQLAPVRDNEQGLSHWLNEQEAEYDLVVYLADAELTSWSRRSVRQADQVIIVETDESARPPGPIEKFAFEIHPPSNRRLVLIHRQRADAVRGTAAHLAGRDVFMHHHVALQDDNDLECLGRFLTGRAVGFVAGGGGGFGPAHIGIFQAFEDRGVKFDIVGGTSVGAAMMAARSFNCTAQYLVDGAEDIFITSRGLKRPTWPRYALLDHINFDLALQRQYRGYNIEDTWRNYFALSTDLSMNAPYVHRSGPLWRAVRASASIPGVLPPVFENGHMLVDGGLVDNVPLATMQQLKQGPNVIVHFGLPTVEKYDVDYASIPGRKKLAIGLLSPFHRKWLPSAPGPIEVLRRSLLTDRLNIALPTGPHDLVIHPPVFPGASFMDWSQHRAVFDASYRWANAYIGERLAQDDPAMCALLRMSDSAN